MEEAGWQKLVLFAANLWFPADAFSRQQHAGLQGLFYMLSDFNMEFQNSECWEQGSQEELLPILFRFRSLSASMSRQELP